MFFFIGCSSKNIYNIENKEDYNQDIDSKSMAIINGVSGTPSISSAIAVNLARPIGDFLFKDMIVRKANNHLYNKDSLLSSLKDPYFKYTNGLKELWVYFDVVSYNVESSIYFIMESDKIINLYTNVDDIPDAKNYKKDEKYVDPYKKYRGY
jgi:hypothetical protein